MLDGGVCSPVMTSAGQVLAADAVEGVAKALPARWAAAGPLADAGPAAKSNARAAAAVHMIIHQSKIRFQHSGSTCRRQGRRPVSSDRCCLPAARRPGQSGLATHQAEAFAAVAGAAAFPQHGPLAGRGRDAHGPAYIVLPQQQLATPLVGTAEWQLAVEGERGA